ncbi:MAG TPA: FAD-binding domain [Steroidobacteraceae bacterium]|jgi:2-polyprenyl-6-methoxyphenol hydroxylase-like FAD-dependent oxidoreductase
MKVAINGVGIAGPTLAYWLRRGNHEPVMFERATKPRTGGYLIDFWGLGYDIAQRMGILPTLTEAGYLVNSLRMLDADGHQVAALDVEPMRRLLHGRFISVARTDLAAVLLHACGDTRTHFGVTIAGIAPEEDGVVVKLSNGTLERFDLVIGADGLHSRVRELAFGSTSQFERSLDCYVAAFRIPGYAHREELTYVSHTVPERQVGRVSLRNDETMVILICRAHLIGDDPPRRQQRAALRRAFANMAWEVPQMLDAMERADEVYFDRVSQMHLPRWSGPRVGLVGDAAACVSLLAGEGAGLAMVESFVLAGELHRAGSDVARALEMYEQRLRTLVLAKQAAALRYRSFFSPRTSLALHVRNLAVRSMSLPFLAKRFISRSLHDRFELPDYFDAGSCETTERD